MQFAKFFLTEYLDTEHTPWSALAEDYVYPSDNFVVAYLPDGTPVEFSDNTWPLQGRERGISQRKVIYLGYAGEQTDADWGINIKQSKSILLALDRHAFKSPGTPLGVDSINRYNLVLQKTRMYCYQQCISVFQALSSAEHVQGIHKLCLETAKSNAAALEDLLPKISMLPFQYLGFKPATAQFKPASTSKNTKNDQTLAIPTAIYIELLLGYKNKIADYMEHRSQLQDLAQVISWNHRPGETSSEVQGEAFKTAIARCDLTDYVEANNITDKKELLSHFGVINYCAAMLIYAFTGMRRSELYSLRLSALRKDIRAGVVISRSLYGFTTKLHKRRKYVSWYSSADIEMPFAAASHVCETILTCNEIIPDDQYVFISTAYFPFSNTLLDPATINSEEPVAGNYEPSRFQRRLSTPPISAEDMKELKNVDPLRIWDVSNDIRIGNAWPLSIHQLRRSTAVYAIRSGIVTLPALKLMLKHISIVMTKYYSGGSIYAPDILKAFSGNKDSMVALFQESERHVASWQYTNEVVMSEETLYGAHGAWAQIHGKKSMLKLSYAERFEETLKRVKKGQLSYRPTPLGGCTSNSICTKRISVDLLGCDGCASAVVIKPKLLKLIALQNLTVDACVQGSMEHTAELQTQYELSSFATRLGIQA
nr:hypothetical protein [uncultured Pseudomonas sp.]